MGVGFPLVVVSDARMQRDGSGRCGGCAVHATFAAKSANFGKEAATKSRNPWTFPSRAAILRSSARIPQTMIVIATAFATAQPRHTLSADGARLRGGNLHDRFSTHVALRHFLLARLS
ncbi:hypothetical protein [Ralstonia flatus]|uniref:Uncharacterized protein n=1 Tax=Ralstonia flatus TaxID=3058601 RepID=A0AAD2C1P6_9RALS|nr:hypothetical protein [Ralstonia sp. LMG 32965]CAJ0887607.1 hypothetical protein R77567_03949 [Ralstonia sp. LMG 32965]CAJ0900249.1 hypothetical protein R77564_04424 [Ralstonia sp. LMG 32965]